MDHKEIRKLAKQLNISIVDVYAALGKKVPIVESEAKNWEDAKMRFIRATDNEIERFAEFRKLLKLTTTSAHAMAAVQQILPSKSIYAQTMQKRWEQLTYGEARVANTKMKAWTAYTTAPKGTPAGNYALRKWISIEKKKSTLKHLIENETYPGSREQKFAIKRYVELFGGKNK